MNQHPPGIAVYCYCTCMCKRKHKRRESVKTHLLYSLLQHPSSLSGNSDQTCLLLSDDHHWHTAVLCDNHRWLFQDRSLNYDLCLFRHSAPCCEKRHLLFSLGFVIDAGCTIVSGVLCGCRTHHNVNIWEVELQCLFGKCDTSLAKLLLASKFFFLLFGKTACVLRNNWWLNSHFYSKTAIRDLKMALEAYEKMSVNYIWKVSGWPKVIHLSTNALFEYLTRVDAVIPLDSSWSWDNIWLLAL